MAKGKGGGNNYRPIKNPELLGGQKDNRTIAEQAANKRPEAKQDKETFVQALDRNRQAQKEGKFSIDEKLNERRVQTDNSTKQSQQKDSQKDREKDIDHDKDF